MTNALDVLKTLDAGQIDYSEAMSRLKTVYSISPNISNSPASKARKLKVIIRDSGKRYPIPSIPFWLMDITGSLGIKIALRHSKYKLGSKEFTAEDIDELNFYFKKLLSALRNYGPFNLVTVEDLEDNTFVDIRLL